ncbi:BRCA1-associated protein 2-domain-containing protein [Phascolomyces articulosus]|uniref:BRCA1-associated protein 2-domain-containing protein n=1 Tax=Phascolomyces articulosus TaxID=60185 RepID=A0AAD5PE85_9FUNG|nr:BRCA1-associated protein 2-domain-containing protein [Phascolomyces articulosus]
MTTAHYRSHGKISLDLVGLVVPLANQPDHGILHLYRGNDTVQQENKEQKDTSETTNATLDIPSYMTVPDFLSFVEPVDSFVSHYRIIRETDPDKYMVLMKFRDPKAAHDYYSQYNNRRFSSMESETCRVMYIQSVEMNSVLMPPYTFPFVNDTTIRRADDDTPICSVCLERMDEKVTGLLTILCQHTFHCYCLSKWGDGSCPVCRYSQKPINGNTGNEEGLQDDPQQQFQQQLQEASSHHHHHHQQQQDSQEQQHKQWSYHEANECSLCGSTENLWICLICGHIGCEQSAHAMEHSNHSNHPYALEIETQRVWDFASNGYVHRLIQNMVDGKLVELPSTGGDDSDEAPSGTTPRISPGASQEKLDAMSLEYSYLMTSQLDSQRIYYEDFLDDATCQLSALTAQVKGLTKELQAIHLDKEQTMIQCQDLKTTFKDGQQRKERVDQSLQKYKDQYENSRRQLAIEKENTNTLFKENETLQESIEQKQKMVKELGDQVRDLKFFLEAREKVQEHPELGGGSVGTRSSSSSTGRKAKRGAKR